MSLHPSQLLLERFALHELDGNELVTTGEHLARCESCARQLEQMQQQTRHYSQSAYSAPARTGFVLAERQWRRQALAIGLVPVAVALAFVVAMKSPAPPLLTAKPAAPALTRQGREAVEVRPGERDLPLRLVSVRARQVQLGQGALEGAADDGPTRPFFLEHTGVVVSVTGFVQTVNVTQVFRNPYSQKLDGVYLFPLPEDAAVDEMTLTAGSRVIRATIEKRETARRLYDEARARGRHAALLDQQRPNLFTQSVANLEPGQAVQVSLRYVAPLRYDDGAYTLNFPMVVAARYTHGNGKDPFITPPQRPGRDISIEVHLDTGVPVDELWSVSHRLSRVRVSDTESVIALDPTDQLPNRDFVLRWRFGGPQPRATTLSGDGALALMLTPPALGGADTQMQRELVFLIDTSCSMTGAPLEAAKRAMQLALDTLHPDDTFTMLNFASDVQAFSDHPVPASAQNLARARSWVTGLASGGGTEQLAGLRRALALQDDHRLRMVLLMTDGLIGDEHEVLAETERLLGSARVFSLGIGESVNHYLLAKVAEVGRGFYQYLRPAQDPGEDIARWARRLARPVMTDIEVDWGTLAVADVVPRKVPDLFDGQPLVLLGRARQAGSSVVKVHGRVGNSRVTLEVEATIASVLTPAPGLKTLWARARVDDLERQQHFHRSSTWETEVTTLGLEYHLVTPFTSLVAVDSAEDEAEWTRTLNNGAPFDGRRLKKTDTFAETREPAGMSLDVAAKALSDKQRALQGCVETALNREPNLAVGAVSLVVEVGKSGAVTSAEVEPASHREADWAKCMTRAARRIVFPASDAETTLEMPFNLGRAAASQTRRAEVLATVEVNKAAVVACVAAWRTPGLLLLRLAIGSNGRVETVTMTPSSPPAARCVSAVATRWVFSTGERETVEVPLNLDASPGR